MIHRYLHDILVNGVKAIQANMDLLDDLFISNYGLTQTETNNVKEYFKAKPPTIVNGYAFRDATFPLIAITLAQEGEAINFIHDDGLPILDEDDPNYLSDVKSSVWQYSYQILIYTENPDATAYYYEIMKSILLASFNDLVVLGCFQFKVMGSDLAPDPKYLPEHLFARQLTFSCQRLFEFIDEKSRLSKAFKLSGIYLDKEIGSGDIGEVKTNIKVIEPISEVKTNVKIIT